MDETLLQQLIDAANNGQPALPDDVLHLPGFSAPRVRHLLNALCSQPDAVYLEIGVHVGSTFIPAVYGNEAKATCIDNWQMFVGAREQFKVHVEQLIPNREINVIDDDCLNGAIDKVPTGVNVYFYDGAHDRESHYQAIVKYAPRLADRFVLLVDDWNWEEPRVETQRALTDLGYTILAEHNLEGVYNGDQEGWWNGLFVGLIQKAN